MPRPVPFVPQMESAECGAACLTMILGYHGHFAPLPEVGAACGASRDGARAETLLRVAESYKLDGVAVRASLEGLREIELPAILHWEFSHFIVLERLSRRHATILDPAVGRQVLSLDFLSERFTGVALLLWPSPAFRKRKRTVADRRRYTAAIRSNLALALAIVTASFALLPLSLLLPVVFVLVSDPRLRGPLRASPAMLFILLLAAFGAKLVLQLSRSCALQRFQIRVDRRLNVELMDRLIRQPLAFFQNRSVGDIAQRLQSNSVIRSIMTAVMASTMLDAILLTAYFAILFLVSSELALLASVGAAAKLCCLLAVRQRRRILNTTELIETGREMEGVIDIFSSIESLNASQSREELIQRWQGRSVRRINTSMRRRLFEAKFGQVLASIHYVAIALVLWVGGTAVQAGRLSIGELAGFLALQAILMSSIDSLVGSLAQFQNIEPCLMRLDDIWQGEPTPRDLYVGEVAGHVRLENVCFSYSSGASPLIRNVSLSIEEKRKIALVGRTGSGKSTLVKLIAGLYVPTSGSILIDGVVVSDPGLARQLGKVGLVLQDGFIFDDSIAYNVSLGDPAIGVDAVRRALSIACFDRILDKLPHGLGTRLGHNGVTLSGGERQRLCLARALARQPPILILDEATSAVDTPTEIEIHRRLRLQRCTMIVIAHRPEPLADADFVVYLDAGQIVTQGAAVSISSERGETGRT